MPALVLENVVKASEYPTLDVRAEGLHDAVDDGSLGTC